MFYSWVSSTKFKGVRYHQHETRKHGVKFDRLYALRYQLGGKRYESILGWASEGWTEEKAGNQLFELKEAYRYGKGAVSLKEKRQLAQAKQKEKERIHAEEEKQNISFAEFFDTVYWPSQQHKAQASLVAERGLYTKWISPVVGNIPLIRLLPNDVEQVKQRMIEAERSPSTIKYAVAVISQVWTIAKRDDLVQGDSPTKKVALPKRDNRRERFLSLEEANLLLAKLKLQSEQTHDIALVALYCGLRFGEIASLEWNCIDFENATISIRDPKSRQNRKAFLTTNLINMFFDRKNKILNARKELTGLVFPSTKNDVMTGVSHTFNRVADALFNQGVTDNRQKVCFHTLRHTFASWLVQKGVGLYDVKELMGHADFKMTQRYSHLSPDGLRKAVSVLEN